MSALAPLDWIVVAVYGAVVLAIGFVANRRQKSSEDYFLAGRRLPWWVVGVSLVATSFSSISLIGGTGYGFAHGMGWLQLQIGDLVALLLVCALFLPFFSRLRLTTAYEYLERRFDVRVRALASALFLGQTLLRASVLICSPAIALAAVTGIDVYTAILLSAGAAILYSALGGLGAVVWTDLIQLSVVVFALGFCLVLIDGDVPGGLGAVLHHARARGQLQVVSLSVSPKSQMNLLGALLPYMVLALSLFGTGQQSVQRFLSVRDLKSARRAALTAWTVGTFALGFTLFLGVCLAAWADLAPAARNFAPEVADAALPSFLGTRLPPGVAGLLLAAIFAASMSSLDSAIHSMSTATIVDFLRRFRRRRPTERAELVTARVATVLIGVLATIGAAYAARTKTQLLDTLITWLGYFAGPLLGLFLLGLLTKRATASGALAGVISGAATVLALLLAGVPALAGFHPIWLAPISLAATVVGGMLASLRGRRPPAEKLNGLTLGR
jgi:SSS family solute:Na+ symporter